MSRCTDPSRQRLVVGVFVIAIGVLALLENLHLVEAGWLRGLWPLVFVAAGVVRLQQAQHSNAARVVGAGLIVLGAAWTLSNFGYMHLSMRAWWPVFLIAAGLWVIARGTQRDRGDVGGRGDIGAPGALPGTPATSGTPGGTFAGFTGPGTHEVHASRVDTTVVLGGSVVRNDSPDFRGGEVTVAMGGLEIDLRQAGMTTPEVKLDVFVLLGGLVLRVPQGWSVVMKGSPLLGGMEDKSVPAMGAAHRLVIDGHVIMGGLEIKN